MRCGRRSDSAVALEVGVEEGGRRRGDLGGGSRVVWQTRRGIGARLRALCATELSRRCRVRDGCVPCGLLVLRVTFHRRTCCCHGVQTRRSAARVADGAHRARRDACLEVLIAHALEPQLGAILVARRAQRAGRRPRPLLGWALPSKRVVHRNLCAMSAAPVPARVHSSTGAANRDATNTRPLGARRRRQRSCTRGAPLRTAHGGRWL